MLNLLKDIFNSIKMSKKKETEDIKVEHEDILNVPKNKYFYELPLKHYINLAKKHGKKAISAAINNLSRWNKKQDPSLSHKARDLMNKLKENKDWIEIDSKD